MVSIVDPMRSLLTSIALLMAIGLTAQMPRVQQAEFFWGADPGAGNGSALTAADGAFTDAFEQLIGQGVPPGAGPQRLSVRLRGADGAWGPVTRTVVDPLAMRSARLEKQDIYWDIMPDTSYGLNIIAQDGMVDDAFEATAVHLFVPPPGLHVVGIRMRGPDGAWGPFVRAVVGVLAMRPQHVAAMEYFWDVDPGAGNATPMPSVDETWNDVVEQVVSVDQAAGLAPGLHVLHVRTKGADSAWGPVSRSVVQVAPLPMVNVNFDLRMALQGCMGTAALMGNALRTQGLVPLAEPYTQLGFPMGLYTGASTNTAVMNVAFPPGASVVDWVLLELRPSYAPDQVTLRMPLLLRRGGTVADPNGTYPFSMAVPGGLYHVIVRHRNHLPVCTAAPVDITQNGAQVAVDLTVSGQAALGANATVLKGSLYCLWAGDVDGDGRIKYMGSGNDRDRVLQAIGGTSPTGSVVGYRIEDVDLDGVVRYTGTNNDRDPILVNIGGSTPTNVREAHMP